MERLPTLLLTRHFNDPTRAGTKLPFTPMQSPDSMSTMAERSICKSSRLPSEILQPHLALQLCITSALGQSHSSITPAQALSPKALPLQHELNRRATASEHVLIMKFLRTAPGFSFGRKYLLDSRQGNRRAWPLPCIRRCCGIRELMCNRNTITKHT